MTQKGNFHNEPMETASKESIHELQSRRLRAIVDHVYESNAVYRHLFDEKGIRPEDIRTAEDVVRLPMTSKDILRESYPLKMACVPRDQIVEMHMSSGSTGTPVVMPYTRAGPGPVGGVHGPLLPHGRGQARRRHPDHAPLRPFQRRLWHVSRRPGRRAVS